MRRSSCGDPIVAGIGNCSLESRAFRVGREWGYMGFDGVVKYFESVLCCEFVRLDVFAEICQHGTQEASRQEGRPQTQAFPPQVRQEGGTQAQTPSLCQEG